MPDPAAGYTATVLATHPTTGLMFCRCAAGCLHMARVALACPNVQAGIDKWFEVRRDMGATQIEEG